LRTDILSSGRAILTIGKGFEDLASFG
jgi:alkanesulfonate monooxygenase SsuD/methylene tetrahydromethanopterin reductase-like flavin-dependent oxidoreductase (luciferase family)